MAYLEENEWMLLNDIAYNISFIYSPDEMRERILERLKLIIDYDAAAFALLQQEAGEYKAVQTVGKGMDQKMLETWQDGVMATDDTRWIVYSAKNTAFRESDLLSEQKRKDSRFYQDFCFPCCLHFALGLCIVFREDPVALLKLYRRSDKEDFSLRDLFVLDQLQKHFAYRLYYEVKKGDTRYFYAKGYHEKICRQYQFTDREGEVFNYAVKGYSNDEISAAMNISVHTVKKHFHSIYSKMNVKNRVQMLQCLPLSTSKINFDEL